MKIKIAGLSIFTLVLVLISQSSFSQSGNFLSDKYGNKVLDGNDNCVLAHNGSNSCAKPVMATKPKVFHYKTKTIVENISFSGDSLFATNSSELTEVGKKSIHSIIAGSIELKNFKVSLHGHADSRGDDGYNLILSELRAISVADYMVSQGVKSSSISVFGFGESKPIATNKTSKGRAKNRRVDAFFSGQRITKK
jgi:outer membrane protein OmpA-like peptidoglycan-associated protein